MLKHHFDPLHDYGDHSAPSRIISFDELHRKVMDHSFLGEVLLKGTFDTEDLDEVSELLNDGSGQMKADEFVHALHVCLQVANSAEMYKTQMEIKRVVPFSVDPAAAALDQVQEELEELGAEMRELKEDSRELVGTMRKLLRQEQAEEKQQEETLRGDNPPRGHEWDHGGGESPRPHSRS